MTINTDGTGIGLDVSSSKIGVDVYVNAYDNSGTPTIIKSSSNVSSLTDRGTGLYTINMSALTSADYTAVGVAKKARFVYEDGPGTVKTTTAYGFTLVSTGNSPQDWDWYMVITGA